MNEKINKLKEKYIDKMSNWSINKNPINKKLCRLTEKSFNK